MLEYFTDSVLRAPTIGSMLMCFTAALVGVIVFLRKQSLLGESLSHAAYPGVIIGVICSGLLSIDETQGALISWLMMAGAFLTAVLAFLIIIFLERQFKFRSDSALCFVLASFFGIGVTLASQTQFEFPPLYRLTQIYLYGQSATMTDIHIIIYGALCIAVVGLIVLFYKELQIITFDREYAQSLKLPTAFIDSLVFIITVLSIVIGIRCVGVVLMSAMLIAPAIAARQLTNKFSHMLALAGFFGLLSGFLGNYLSTELTVYLSKTYTNQRLVIPTGPLIVIIASLFCLASLLFSPERGIIPNALRNRSQE